MNKKYTTELNSLPPRNNNSNFSKNHFHKDKNHLLQLSYFTYHLTASDILTNACYVRFTKYKLKSRFEKLKYEYFFIFNFLLKIFKQTDISIFSF